MRCGEPFGDGCRCTRLANHDGEHAGPQVAMPKETPNQILERLIISWSFDGGMTARDIARRTGYAFIAIRRILRKEQKRRDWWLRWIVAWEKLGELHSLHRFDLMERWETWLDMWNAIGQCETDPIWWRHYYAVLSPRL